MTNLTSMINNYMPVSTSSQKEVAEKILFLPDLFEKILKGSATTGEMAAMAALYSKYGIAVLNLAEPIFTIPNIKSPNSTSWTRYGSEDKPIFSCALAGNTGTPGAVLISVAQGETCLITEFDKYMGPLHYHHDVVHITAVIQGFGFFLIEGAIGTEKYLVKVPVQVGDIALIPANTIHTFFICSSEFQVASFTSNLIPTDSPDFLVLADFDQFKTRPFIDYAEFLKRKNLQVALK